jgi:hypothetical protein
VSLEVKCLLSFLSVSDEFHVEAMEAFSTVKNSYRKLAVCFSIQLPWLESGRKLKQICCKRSA